MDAEEVKRRAADARALLTASPGEHAAYRELPPEARRRRQLLDVIAVLFPDAPPLEHLDDFRELWAWVHARDFSWETWEPGEPPTGDFDNCVLDGRPDLTAEDASSDAAVWLASENTDAWVAIAHGHDGHRFLFWDTSADELVVHEVDNQDRDVVIMSWQGVETFLHGFVIEMALRSLDYAVRRAPAARLSRAEEIGCWLGCAATAAATVWLVWFLVT